jgi:rRNA maturation RNase YbeY
MPVHFHNEKINFRLKNKRDLKSWIRNVCLIEGKDLSIVNIIFTNDEFLIGINKKFLNHDFYTDIISFDYSEGVHISGDVYISIDRVKDNALTFDVSFNEELKRVIIHGILHLCGYKDKEDEERLLMRNLEDKALRIVNELIII